QIPFWVRLQIDHRLLLLLLGLIIVSNLLAGLWPALQATRRDVNDLLKTGGAGLGGAHTGKLRQTLVVSQIAFSAVVLTQAVVLLAFNYRIQQVRLPFDPTSLLAARIDSPWTNAASFYDQLESHLAILPGVSAAALTTKDPTGGHAWQQIGIE